MTSPITTHVKIYEDNKKGQEQFRLSANEEHVSVKHRFVHDAMMKSSPYEACRMNRTAWRYSCEDTGYMTPQKDPRALRNSDRQGGGQWMQD